MTPEQKAAAKAKRAATRKARGIIEKRHRAAVKGDVTGVIITPVTAPQAEQPAQVAQPAQQTAPSASNGGNATK